MPLVLPWYRRSGPQALALALLSFLLYANTLGHDFTLDDAIVITDNSVVNRGVSGWADLFTHDTFYGFFGEQDRASLVAGGRYRPLTPALFALEGEVADGPFLYHLFNVLWYAALGVVVFFTVRELVRDKELAWWLPLATAALFVAHPVHTEAVANIKGRDEILALLGALCATWMVLRASRDGSWWAASAGGMLFLVGCFAKENAITFLIVTPLLLFTRRDPRYRCLIPMALAAAGYLAVRFAVIGTGIGDPPTELMNNPFLLEQGGGVVVMTFWERLPTVIYTALLYLKLMVWPVNLVHDYYPTAIELKSWSHIWVWISLIVHIALLALAGFYLRSRRPIVAAGILTYFITLSIVSNLLFSVGTLMSERFLFMPSFGFLLAVVALLARWQHGRWIAIAVVPVFCMLTVLRNPVWSDNYTLFTTEVARQPNSAKLRNAAAGARLDRYQQLPEERRAGQAMLIASALEDLNAALRIHPRYGNAYLLRGNAHYLQEDYGAAIADYQNASAFGVADGTVNGNLALALQQAGRRAGEEQNDLLTARSYLERSLALAPDRYETLRLLGITYGMEGNPASALSYFERALQIEPDNEGARQNVAIARQQLRQLSE